MKKLVLLFALAGTLGVSFAATDSFIYWMVSEDATGTGRSAAGPADLRGTYYARISAFESGQAWTEGGGTYLNILSSSADNNFASKGDGGVRVTIGADNVPYFANIAGCDEAGWTYFIELWNDGANNGGKLVARSEEGLHYSQECIVALSGLNAPGAQVWAPVMFVPAPEPNSAMLLLIGCAALALRRRKQVAA